MTDSPHRPSLLEELDARQDEVLQQLDELNRRIEQLLQEHGARLRRSGDVVGAGSGDVISAVDIQAA
jgi:hypothetical protein